MIKIELTDEEAQSLAEVIDIATKAGGIGVARAALPLFDKLMKSIQDNDTRRVPTDFPSH